MIAATALTVEGAYYFINTFGPEDKNDPIIKAGGLTPAQKEVGKGKVTNLALRSIGRNDYAVIDDGHPVGMRPSAPNEIWMWNVTIPEPGGGHRSIQGIVAQNQSRDWFL